MAHLKKFAVLALAIAFVCPARAQAPLTKNSPFLPVAESAPVATAANENLVLAGASGTGKHTLVCIYDTQVKRSYWIEVGSTAEGIKVINYDGVRDQALVLVGGQQKLLTLRASAVVSGGAATPPASPSFATPTGQAPLMPTQGTVQPPPAPGSVAQQETEARMLVSDLLEIGMQQRKAYEDAQKKADTEKKKT